MRRLVRSIPAALALAVLLSGSFAQSAVTHTFDTGGTTYATTAITASDTDGALMGGMSVTAFFSDATSETQIWAATGVTTGGVIGTKGGGWALSVDDDTFFPGIWQLVNSSGANITRLSLLGSPTTIFDTEFGGNFGTDNSFLGSDFFEESPEIPGLTVEVTYSGAVGVNGAAPLGDVFAKLDARFTSAGGLPNGQTLFFSQDTDNASTNIVEVPPSGVPEPSTFVLAGLGLVGVGLVAWRRRRRG